MYIWWNHSQKTVLVIKTVLKNFKSDQTVLIIVTVLIILSCIIWPMYSTYNSDILKKWETVLIIVTVLIIEKSMQGKLNWKNQNSGQKIIPKQN